MKLASLKQGGRDGTLIVVDRDLHRALEVPGIAATLQQALDDWDTCAPALERIYQGLNRDPGSGFELAIKSLASPLPRAYQWLDGSAYLVHVERVRKARGAELPAALLSDPLMYQGGSDGFLGPCDPIRLGDERWGGDFEGEVAVITDDVPMGISSADSARHIKLLMLVNDISLRKLIPAELGKNFGFLHGKPASAFSPVAVTPDELGAAWYDAKVHLPLRIGWNGILFGQPDAGTDMQFSFADLTQHAARTRSLGAGTIIGSGTVSNADTSRGCCCIVERRVLEIIAEGSARTGYLSAGDTVRIEMLDSTGRSVFGAIDQVVEVCPD